MADHQLTGCQLTDYQWTGYQELAASCLAASCLVTSCLVVSCLVVRGLAVRWGKCTWSLKQHIKNAGPPNLKARITCAFFSSTRPSSTPTMETDMKIVRLRPLPSTPTMETDMKIVRLRPLRPRWQAGNHQRSLRNATVLQKLKWLGIMPCIWRHAC